MENKNNFNTYNSIKNCLPPLFPPSPHRHSMIPAGCRGRVLSSRVEVRVYVQKVKHLEYEHHNTVKSIAADGERLLDNEGDLHRSIKCTEAQRHRGRLCLSVGGCRYIY